MTITMTAALFAAMQAATTGATVAPSAEAPQQGQQQAAKDPNEKICRQIKITGSRMPQKQCLTRAEWRELIAASKKGD